MKAKHAPHQEVQQFRSLIEQEKAIKQLRELAGNPPKKITSRHLVEASKRKKSRSVGWLTKNFGSFYGALDAAGLLVAENKERAAIRELHFLTRRYGCRLAPSILKAENHLGRCRSARTLMRMLGVSSFSALLKRAKCWSDAQVAILQGKEKLLSTPEICDEYGIRLGTVHNRLQTGLWKVKARVHSPKGGRGGQTRLVDAKEVLSYWWRRQYSTSPGAVFFTIKRGAEMHNVKRRTVEGWAQSHYLIPVGWLWIPRGRPARLIAQEDLEYLKDHRPSRGRVKRKKSTKYSGL